MSPLIERDKIAVFEIVSPRSNSLAISGLRFFLQLEYDCARSVVLHCCGQLP